MPGIQAVIFDLGRVLVDIDMSRGLFARLAGSAGEGDRAVIERLRRDRLMIDVMCGRITPEELHRGIRRRTGLAMGFGEFTRLWCDIFEPMPDMEDLFREVAARVRIGLLSDTDPLHWSHLCRHFPMLMEVERPTLSYEVGALKPAPAAYRAAAGNVGVPPEACFFTDDLAENVEGARRAGMDAELFRGANDLRRQLAKRGIFG